MSHMLTPVNLSHVESIISLWLLCISACILSIFTTFIWGAPSCANTPAVCLSSLRVWLDLAKIPNVLLASSTFLSISSVSSICFWIDCIISLDSLIEFASEWKISGRRRVALPLYRCLILSRKAGDLNLRDLMFSA